MYKSIQNDLVYCLLILKSISRISLYSEDLNNQDEFYAANEGMNFDASITQLTQIAELIKKLSEELKIKYSSIPWVNIVGFRNRIVHDYDRIDIGKVFMIVTEEINSLEKEIWEIIKEELELGNFTEEEYLIAKASEFYKSIEFKV